MGIKKEQSDGPLSPEEETIVASLSDDFIQKVDCALLSHAKPSWRKVAMLVGLTMMDSDLRVPGLPDLFYSIRIRKLVEMGLFESVGDLDYMRFSDIRLPQESKIEA